MHVPRQASRCLVPAVLAATAGAAVLASGAVSAAPQKAKAHGKRVNATLTEYAVRSSRRSAPSGRITFVARNKGKVTHELVIVRTNAAANKLPQQSGKVSERGPVHVVDEIEGIKPGATKSLTLPLSPGRYVLICNIVGHYAKGMHAALRVR